MIISLRFYLIPNITYFVSYSLIINFPNVPEERHSDFSNRQKFWYNVDTQNINHTFVSVCNAVFTNIILFLSRQVMNC